MDASASGNINFNTLLQQANLNPVAFLQSLEQLLEDFGPEGVASASSQRFLERFGDALKDIINNSDLPQPIKDAANEIIDAHTSCPCDANAAEAVENSELAETVDCLCDEAIEEVNNECPCSGDAADGADNDGGTELSPEAQAEADAEAENEGTGGAGETEGSGGAGGAGGGDPMTGDDLMNELAGNEGGRRRGKSWLEVLAGTLADIQSKFLDNAMKASEIMSAEADNASPDAEGGGGTQSAEFLQAQASYTANMQLFTIFSNQVSTSIKSVGEGLAGISRKQ